MFTQSLETAQQFEFFVECEGGYMCFNTATDLATWEAQV